MTVAVSSYARHAAADTLDVALVTAEKGMTVSRSDTVSFIGYSEPSKALMAIPGLTVSDMGGMSGLKTTSLRGMGTAHTAIFIDGIRVNNIQSGQGDLGMLDVGQFGKAVVDYAQNSINFISLEPEFRKDSVGQTRKTTVSTSLKGGSFGTWLPEIRFGWRLCEKIILNLNGSAAISKGNFPYSSIQDGQTKQLRRNGNDISRVRGGVDLQGIISHGGWNVKAFMNSSDRGTPGSVSWPSEDRQKDINIFIQGSMYKSFTPSYTLKASVKYSYDDMKYLSNWGDSHYEQNELQVNSSHIFRIKDWWTASFALGGHWDRLESGNYGIATDGSAAKGIDRADIRASAATRISLKRITADLAAEYEGVFDSSSGKAEASFNSFSPSVSIRYNALKGLDILGFARRAYRVPMFNELYYIGFGNPDLNPEDAWLTDIGAEWKHELSRRLKMTAKADGFFNWLSEKITSAPSGYDPNIWLPYNIGKVFSTGADMAVSLNYSYHEWSVAASAKYAFQNAEDRTSGSMTYGQQIPYIARHSGILCGDAAWKGWELLARWNIRSGLRDSSGDMPSWNTLDVTLSKQILAGKSRHCPIVVLSMSGYNITDNRYELARDYPMPGRSIIGGVNIVF